MVDRRKNAAVGWARAGWARANKVRDDPAATEQEKELAEALGEIAHAVVELGEGYKP